MKNMQGNEQVVKVLHGLKFGLFLLISNPNPIPNPADLGSGNSEIRIPAFTRFRASLYMYMLHCTVVLGAGGTPDSQL